MHKNRMTSERNGSMLLTSRPDSMLQPYAPDMVSRSEAERRAIVVRNLVKAYPGVGRALDGLSFEVETGTIFGLLGPNGAGKSTTVKILTTLTRQDDGEVYVTGINRLQNPEHIRRAIGYVAQRSAVDIEATGRENLVLQGRLYGLGKSELKFRVAELLEQFNLTHASNWIVRTYSGGMQRKLDVAMGLVHRPHVLFLDEPTTGLDPEARAELWKEINRLSKEGGCTVLLTTHYLEEADRLAHRLAIIDQGRLVAEGSPDQLKGELKGDSIHIEILRDETQGDPKVVLSRINGLREIAVQGRLCHMRADCGATAVPLVLTSLESKGIRVASVKVARPSLDDVYLRHSGRTFDQADH
jgi:ABC-2 type transport system ATP-binding protein